jgi:hypothetical protein
LRAIRVTIFVTVAFGGAVDLFFYNESLQMQQQGLGTNTTKRNKNKKVSMGRLQRLQSIENAMSTYRERMRRV